MTIRRAFEFKYSTGQKRYDIILDLQYSVQFDTKTISHSSLLSTISKLYMKVEGLCRQVVMQKLEPRSELQPGAKEAQPSYLLAKASELNPSILIMRFYMAQMKGNTSSYNLFAAS